MKTKQKNKKFNLPTPPKFSLVALGPGIVLIAMGLGSGEYVLWPYLVAHFGFGVLWGAVLGVTLQYFVSNESGRYTMATGDSVFVGFSRIFRFFPIWFILSTFLSFGWPGIVGSGGQILGYLFGVQDYKWITIAILILIGLALTFGGKVYSTLKALQILFIVITLPILLYIGILLVNPDILMELGKGLFGIGDNYFLFPEGINLGEFLGAIAFAGAGGNLVLSHSFYVQDEGIAMAKYADSEIQIGKSDHFDPKGKVFDITKKSIGDFGKWFNTAAIQQFLTFWTIGVVTIALLTLIAYALVYPFEGDEGLSFIFLQGETLSQNASPLLGSLLLLIGAVFLFTTQLGVFEATSRIMSENLQLISSRFKDVSRSKVFFTFLWLQVAFAIVITLLNIAAPLQILFINTFFSAISMFILSGAVLWLNVSKQLPREIQPGMLRKLIVFASFVFFGIFVIVSLFTS